MFSSTRQKITHKREHFFNPFRLMSLTLCGFAMVCFVVASVHSLKPHAWAGDQVSYDVQLINWQLYSTAAPESIYDITVPNTVLGALVNCTSRYPFDPFFGKNLELINESDFDVPWVYMTNFILPSNLSAADAQSSRVLLQLEGVNYRANLRVNGVLVANESELVGAFRRYELDITPFVSFDNSSATLIAIEVTHERHTPNQWRSFNTALGYNFMDWNPHPADLSMGVYRSASIKILLSEKQSDVPSFLFTAHGFAVKTTLPSTLPGQPTLAFMNASFVIRSWSEVAITTHFSVDFGFNTTSNSDGSSQRVRVVSSSVVVPPATVSSNGLLLPSETRVYITWEDNMQLVVENPPLWWPWQMGDQPLFTATISDASARVLQRVTYGLRDVRTELNAGGALQFYFNNVPLQFRGGGWTSEMFTREKSAERIVQEFTLIRDMGLNGLRLEGMLESDLFYDLADQFGLILLPGLPCCDGWQNWSYWPEENYRIAQLSVRDQARRLGSHPSVIGFFEASDSLPPPNVELMYLTTFVEESWPNSVISSASQQVSNISGNPGVKMVGPYSWEPPSYWLTDGNGLTDGNYGGAWGFFTEGGPGESPMTFASWQRTVPADHLWNGTTQSLDSWWSFHMGEPYGHFRNLTFYSPPLQARYGDSVSARDYLYRAQAANYEGIRAYMESYSRNKHLNATGFVQWLMNNAWPSHLWHLYDYYLVAGGGYYGAKMACGELHAMMSYNDGSVWLINSRFVPFGSVSVTAELIHLNGSIVWSASQVLPDVPADGSVLLDGIGSLPTNGLPWFSAADTFFVRLRWTYSKPSSEAVEARENWYWLNSLPDVMDFPASNGFRTPCTSFTNFTQLNSLPRANITVSSTAVSYRELDVRVAASALNPSVAFFVYLRLVNSTSGLDVAPQLWSDNFVTLLPGATRALHVHTLDGTAVVGSDIEIRVEAWNDQVSLHESV